MMAEMSQQQQEAFQRMSQRVERAFAHMTFGQQQQSLLASQTQAVAAALRGQSPRRAGHLPRSPRPSRSDRDADEEHVRADSDGVGLVEGTERHLAGAVAAPSEPVVPSSSCRRRRTCERWMRLRGESRRHVRAMPRCKLPSTPRRASTRPRCPSTSRRRLPLPFKQLFVPPPRTVPAVAAAAYAEAQRAREECAAADRALAERRILQISQPSCTTLEQMAIDVAKYKQAFADMGATRSALYREHVPVTSTLGGGAEAARGARASVRSQYASGSRRTPSRRKTRRRSSDLKPRGEAEPSRRRWRRLGATPSGCAPGEGGSAVPRAGDGVTGGSPGAQGQGGEDLVRSSRGRRRRGWRSTSAAPPRLSFEPRGASESWTSASPSTITPPSRTTTARSGEVQATPRASRGKRRVRGAASRPRRMPPPRGTA